jgi:23S rRNA (pseudouridine1915-N3)-methyltransferase
MIKIKVIALGKLKEKYLREASDEYVKRLSSYAKTEIIELEPIRLSDDPSEGEVEKALKAEAEMIKKKIPENSLITAMCIEGKQFSSPEFAKELENRISRGAGNLVFIIGSSFGLHDEIKNLADIKLSFSKMTFPHQLFRIMLLEQVYRSFKINEGSKYHK